MSPVKDGQKPLTIKISNQETIDKLTALNPPGGKSNPEFLAELLECYEQLHGKNCDTTPKDYFPNLQGAERKEKEPILKEMFGLESKDPLLMSECELLEKASEYSGKTIAELSLEGRVLIAKNEIGRQVQYAQGKGKKGTADERISQALAFMKHTGEKLSINKLTQRSGSNRSTVERWCKDNNLTFE